MALFEKKEKKFCCCGGNCDAEGMAKAEKEKPRVRA